MPNVNFINSSDLLTWLRFSPIMVTNHQSYVFGIDAEILITRISIQSESNNSFTP